MNLRTRARPRKSHKPRKWYSLREVARELKLPIYTVRRYVRLGRLEKLSLGPEHGRAHRVGPEGLRKVRNMATDSKDEGMAKNAGEAMKKAVCDKCPYWVNLPAGKTAMVHIDIPGGFTHRFLPEDAGTAMTEDEAVERVIEAVGDVAWALAQSQEAKNGWRSADADQRDALRTALHQFAAAIRKQAKADMTCLLLTRETEAMGGYDDGKHVPECFTGACMPGCTSPRFVTGNLKGAAKGG